MSDKELVFDNEIKASMDAALTKDNIFVSDDLIKKTLAAIPGAKDSKAAEWNIEDINTAEVTASDKKIVALRRRYRNIAGISAVAAALVLAVVGFASNLGGMTKEAASINNDMSAPAFMFTAKDQAVSGMIDDAKLETSMSYDGSDMDYGVLTDSLECEEEADIVTESQAQVDRDMSFTTNGSSLMGVVNPIVASDAESIEAQMGIVFTLPEDATEVSYSIISGQIAQVNFETDRASWTLRQSYTSDFEDISGMYYDWGFSELIEGEGLYGIVYLGEDGDSSIGLYLEYDYGTGIQYSASAVAKNGCALEKEELIK